MGSSNQISEWLISKSKRRRSPITVNLELLPVCNLNCKMCYIHTSKKEVSASGGLKKVEEWLHLAEEMKKYNGLIN